MCSINGAVLFSTTLESRKKAVDSLISVIAKGEIRGRDSTGVVACVSPGKRIVPAPSVYSFKSKKNASACLFDGSFAEIEGVLKGRPHHSALVINTDRAEPTTEFIKEKDTVLDVPPFEDEHREWFVAHNGVLANDKDFKYPVRTRIDSAVIPYFLRDVASNYVALENSSVALENSSLDILLFESIRKRLKGSFALAFFYKYYEKLFLYRDFKPLHLCFDFINKAIFFSSSKSFGSIETLGEIRKEYELPPYSAMTIDQYCPTIEKSVVIYSLDGLASKKEKKRALVVCSGGLDSTTAATIAKDVDECEVTLLHFLYNCKAQEKEVLAVKAIAEYLECEHKFVDMSWLGKIGGSSLTGDGVITERETSAEAPHEWVPARNTVMIAYAAALCDRYGYDRIYLGLNLEEGGAYPDNTEEFYEKFNQVLQVGTLERPKIMNPLSNLMKPEIVKIAMNIGAPIHLSWSCYHEGDLHCGKCGPCFMRRTAFKMAGFEEVIEYEDEQ